MTEAKETGRAEPKRQPDDEAPDPNPATPGAHQADRQDKTKDKPDSGKNEDG